MQNFEPRLSDATSPVTPTLPRVGMRQRLLSATLCLSAGGGNAIFASAAMANAPQLSFLPTHATSAASWQTSSSGHVAAARTAVQAQSFTHALLNHTPSNNSASTNAAMHWLPSALGQNSAFKTGAAGSALLNSTLQGVPGAKDVNLYSPVAQFAAGSLAGFHTITIDVGGKKEQLDFNTKLTGAELLAAQQVLDNGKQSLVVNGSGVATGGTFNLNASSLTAIDGAVGGSIGTLDISRGVVLVDSLSNLNLVGSLVNFGTIRVGGSTGNSLSENIAAANIFNANSGIISGAGKGTSLFLASSGDFVNQGTITANRNLDVSATTVTNSGLLSAGTGSVTLTGSTASGASAEINFNGAGGTVQALKGNINFNTGDFVGASNISVVGGNFLSQSLNFNAGSGAVNANMGQVSGLVNGTAGSSHIIAATQDLKLGNIANAGDPTYYNTAGDITIDGSISSTGGADLAIVASGNIIANGGKIDTTQGAGNSGNVTLIAGADISASGPSGSPAPATDTITVTGGSTSGGFIDLSGITYTGATKNLPVTAITTGSVTGNSGNVTMVAYKGTGTNSGNVQATATSAQKNGASTIDTVRAQDFNTGGNVTIIAGGTAVNAQNISVNSDPAGNKSTITILGMAPVIAGAAGSSLSITDGTVTGSYSTTPSNLTAANITLGTLNAGTVLISTAGTINEAKGGNITAGNITLSAASVGTSKAALLTNASTNLTVNGSSTTASFVADGSSAAEVDGVSTAPGQSVTVTELGTNLNVGNLNYTNVTLTNASKVSGGGNIVLNPNGTSGYQVGEVYSTASTKTNALGNGTITIAASGNITEGAGADTLPVVVGKTVTMTSTAGSIGQVLNGSMPVTISGAFLTANAVKGSVNINDLAQTTLNKGSAATTNTAVGSGVYDVTGNGLAVAGVINGYDISLTSGPGVSPTGGGSAVALNANVGSSKSNSVQISATGGIVEQNAKAIVAGINVVLAAPTGSSIGSAVVPVQTKATSTLTIEGSTASAQSSAYVNQTGNITILASGNTGAGGTLVLKDSGVLTLGIAGAAPQAAALNYGQLTLQSANVVLNNSAFKADTVFFQSPSALTITGAAPSTFAVRELHFEGTTATGATSITLGNAKDGSSNPFNGGIFVGGSAVSNVVINTKGNFVSSLSNISTSAGAGSASQSISVSAAAIVRTGSPDGPLVISTAVTNASSSGNITISLSGSAAVTLSDAGTALQISGNNGTGGGGTVSITTKGGLIIDGSGLSLPGGSTGENLNLNAASISISPTSPGTISAANVTLVAPTILVGANGVVTAANSTTITGKGALNISGTGTINAGENLTLGSTTVDVNGVPTGYVATAITLGGATGTSGNPLVGSFGNNLSATLSNLTISTTGNLTSANSSFYLNTANPGSVSISVAALVNSSAIPLPQATVISAAGVGTTPGNIAVSFSGAQTVSLGSGAGQIELIATTDQAAGGGNISVSSKGNLQTSLDSIVVGANSTISLASTGGSFIESGITVLNGLFVNSGANTTLSLSGAKGISIQDDRQLVSNNFTNLTITSGSATTLTIGFMPTTPAGQANWINGSIGTYTFGNTVTSANSLLDSLTINTAGGVSLVQNVQAGTISVAPTGSLTFNSTGQLTILADEGSIQPGSYLSINGVKGVTFGLLDAQDSKNPFQFLESNDSTNPVSALTINTSGTFSTSMTQAYVEPTAAPMGNVNGPQFQSFAITPAAYFGPQFIDVKAAQINAIDKTLGLFGLFFLGAGGPAPALGPQVQGITPQVTPTSGAPTITVDITGAQNLTLGQAPSGNSTFISATINGTQGGTVNISTLGTVTVGVPNNLGGPAVSIAGPGAINITSGGNQIINTGAISLPTGAQIVDLNLTSAKSLAVYDSTLLNNSSLSSVTLSSAGAGSFVVGATGTTFANGTAGAIAAPNVTIITPSLTNNLTIDGSGLTLGAPGTKPFAVVATGTGTWGATTPFSAVSITSAGTINLGNLFTSNVTLGDSSVDYVSISGPNSMPSGTVTFAPTGTGITVGADPNSFAGGSINIDAKSFVYAPKTGPLNLTFDASASSMGNSGSIHITTTSALTLGTAKGNILVNVGGSGARGTIGLASTAGTLTLGGPGLFAFDLSLAGNNVVVGTSVAATAQINLATNGKAGTGVISQTTGGMLSTDSLQISQGSTKLSTVALNLAVNNLDLVSGALNLDDTPIGGLTVQGFQPIAALNLTVNGNNVNLNVQNIATTNGSINIIQTGSFGQMDISGAITAKNGSILLQSDSTIGGGQPVIVISNATIYASGTTPGVGQVSIVIGPPPIAANLVAGVTPSNVTSVQTVGGNVYMGVIGSTGGTFDRASGSVQLNALGRNIVIYEGEHGGSIETFATDTITADPPVGAASAGGQTIQVSEPAPAVQASAMTVPVATPAPQAITAGTINLNGAITNARVESGAYCNDGFASNLSMLCGAVANTSTRTLQRGVSLLSPDSDTVVETGFGSVCVAAHSVVIIMSFEGGVAVYNLHDTRRGAVAVKLNGSGGENIAVAPGRSAVLTTRNVRCFEEINPAQSVAYRSLTARNLSGGVKAFQGDYSIMSLLQAAEPLKQFARAQTPANQKAIGAMLKTAAILMQSGGAAPYQTMTAPQLTAQAITH